MKALRIAAFCLLAAWPATVSVVSEAQSQQTDVNVPQPMREKMFPLGVSYIAVSLNGREFPGERPAVLLDDNFRLRGFAGCNNYSAIAYPQQQQGIAVGPFALTKRSCERAIMDSERSFLVALRSAQKWDVQGSTLIISGPNGELRLERSL
jgi:heat shock protein HslJ